MSPLHSLLLLAFSCLLPSVQPQGFKHFPVVAGRGPPPPQRQPSSSRAIDSSPPPSRQAVVSQRIVSKDDSSSERRRDKNPNKGRGRGRTNSRTRAQQTPIVEQPSPVKSQTRIRPRPRPTPPPQQQVEQGTGRFQSTLEESNTIPTIRTKVQAFQNQKVDISDEIVKNKPRFRLPQTSVQNLKPAPVRAQSSLTDSLSSIFSDQPNPNSISDGRFIPEQPRFAAVPNPRPQFTSSVAQTASTRLLTPSTPTPKPIFIFQPAIQNNELNSLREQLGPQVSGQQDRTQFSQIQQQPISPQFARPAPAVPQRETSRERQTPRPQRPKPQIQQNIPVQNRFSQTAPVENVQPFNPTSLFSQEIKVPEGTVGDGVYFSYEATLSGRRR